MSRLVFLNEGHLRKTISIFIGHYRHRRYHQGIENKLVEPPVSFQKEGRIRCQKQLGGMLNYYTIGRPRDDGRVLSLDTGQAHGFLQAFA